jgi:hypothetical protein
LRWPRPPPRAGCCALAEAFDAAPVTLVAGIVFNGYVSAKDRATGQPVRPLLLSVHADRDAFGKIVLDEPEFDPTACLRGYLNAVISPHPWDLEPVKPVLQFDLSRYKFVDEMSVVAGLNGRPDLLALKPEQVLPSALEDVPLWHLRHVRNLPSIIESGALFPFSGAAAGPAVDIARADIRQQRSLTRVPAFSDRRITDSSRFLTPGQLTSRVYDTASPFSWQNEIKLDIQQSTPAPPPG